jgi:hypothetical protein
VIEVRFQGPAFPADAAYPRGEAFVQALEIGKNLPGKGTTPISSSSKP